MPNTKQGSQGRSNQDDSAKSGRGFASMDSERQREIASQGGRASHGSDTTKSQAGRGASETSNSSSGTRGGTSEQHARAGSQSHKNDR